MSKFAISSKFNLGYKIASLISDSIDLKHGENTQYEYFWIWRTDYEEELQSKLLETYPELSTPAKDTILHDYIYNFYFAFFEHKRHYFFKDYLKWNEFDHEEAIGFFEEEFVSKIELYGKINEIDQADIDNFYGAIESYGEEERNKTLDDFFDFFESKLEDISDLVVDEVFSILFMNKNFLFNFSKKISTLVLDLIEKKLVDGPIQRPTYLPKWLTRAVFFRDQGFCQICFKDLRGTTTLLDDREVQYDHIVPLEKGGTNDPSNFQLTCNKCNSSKSTHLLRPSENFILFWEREYQ